MNVYVSRIVEISIYGLTRGAGSHPLLLYWFNSKVNLNAAKRAAEGERFNHGDTEVTERSTMAAAAKSDFARQYAIRASPGEASIPPPSQPSSNPYRENQAEARDESRIKFTGGPL